MVAMIYLQHHREELPLSERKRYDAIVAGMKKAETRIDVALPMSPSGDAVQAALYDHPELFYYSDRYQITGDSRRTTYLFERPYPKEHYSKLIAQMKAIFARDFNPIKGKSDYEKVLFVHDWISSRVRYDLTDPDSFTIVGPFLKGHAACQGVALLATFMLEYLDVKAFFVAGKLGKGIFKSERHGWNAVEVEGKWCYLDITNDLGGGYSYVCLDEETLRRTHSFPRPKEGSSFLARRLEFNHPEMEYHAHFGFLFSSVAEAADSLSRRLLRKGDKASVKLSVDGEDNYGEAIFHAIAVNAPCTINYRFSPETQTYFFERTS